MAQPVAPFLTQHSADPDWPLVVAVDERGRSYHACADCGTEVPDGARVERVDGQVVAYSASYHVEAVLVPPGGKVESESPHALPGARRELVERERTVHHECEAGRG